MANQANKQGWEERVTEPVLHKQSGVRSKVQNNPQPLAGMRVLWLDPDHASSTQCRAMLQNWGAVIVVIEDSDSCIDAAALARPDAVVISDDREGSTGVRIARILHFVVPDPPPVILVSKSDFRGYDGDLPGIVRVLPKPFDPRAMLDTLWKIEKAD